MNRYRDTPQPDKEIMRRIVTALKPLGLDNFDQRNCDFYWDADGKPLDDPKCPVCVGLRIAIDCDLERRYIDFGYKEASYEQGQTYVALAAAQTPSELNNLLHKHGAPSDPFSRTPWDKRPFDYLKSAFEEVLGDTIYLD